MSGGPRTGVDGAAGAAVPGRESARGGLRVDVLVVRYGAGDGATVAVDRVTLGIAPGEVVALLGPSGCGKSSLLRAVAGLEPAAAGTVTWDGADLAGVPVHRRGFGLMFQDGQLFPHRDVGGNVEFGLRMARAPRTERDARVRELLAVVGLAGYERRAVATLSGGEQQRVALARALAPHPRLLLLDEPLSALDRALRERLADDLRTALTATGTTALLVTHDHDEAFAVADRVAVMDAGRLLQVAPPAELWRRPASRRVAEFLGYEAFVALDDPAAAPLRVALASAGRGPTRPKDAAPRLAALVEGALVVAPDGADPAFRGTVTGVSFRRGRAEHAVDVPDLGRVTVLAPAGSTAAPGTVLALAVDPDGVAVLPG
ncbi:thiamine transport system ATP-binding protein [Cellulomonas cellasea]|uniref:ABC-type quaternary amine transporter n=1 Tax=Cellulomonas cellasea TaxID=43670 RepID=A0A7W4YB55_9CELL|nr:thiamine transport system ATP-binding protein [Cellulomonas cellasea]